jgi:hypothetical protein
MANVRNSCMDRAIALLVCLAFGQSLVALSLEALSFQGAGRGSAGSMAGPVKPAHNQITDRQEAAADSSKNRGASLAVFVLAAGRWGGQPLHSEPLDTADQPRQPQTAILRVLRGRAPPSFG